MEAYRSIFPPEAPAPTPQQFLVLWQSWLDPDGSGFTGFVAEVGGRPAGVVLAGRDPAEPSLGHLSRMYVAPDQWGGGVGRALYSAAITHLQGGGYRRASLWVLEANHRARAWYERLGWAATGERRAVYGPGGIDELRYERPITH
jgi:GNAT superfamily N-acetyltransferase